VLTDGSDQSGEKFKGSSENRSGQFKKNKTQRNGGK